MVRTYTISSVRTVQVKQQDKRTTSTKKNFRFNNDLIELINSARGKDSFSAWVQAACHEKLGNSQSENKK